MSIASKAVMFSCNAERPDCCGPVLIFFRIRVTRSLRGKANTVMESRCTRGYFGGHGQRGQPVGLSMSAPQGLEPEKLSRISNDNHTGNPSLYSKSTYHNTHIYIYCMDG